MTAVATVLAHREVPGVRAMSATPVRPVARVGRLSRLRRRAAADQGSLGALHVGSRAVVTGIGSELDPASARRLVDLGFTPGAVVEVLRRAPMADPTIYRVADTEIALRRRHAGAILVASLDH